MDKILTIKERILYFVENQHIKKVDFFDKMGIAPSNFKGIGLKSEIGSEKIVKILTEFPELSSDWLLLGRGAMLRESQEVESDVMEVRMRKLEERFADLEQNSSLGCRQIYA